MPKKACPKCGSKLHLSCADDSSHINGLQIFKDDVEPALGARIDAMFEDLSDPLMVHLLEKCDRFKPLMYRIRILGNDQASAKPWLVILCPAAVVKHVESFFQKPLARQFCAEIDVLGGLEVAYVGRPPSFRSGSWDDVEVALTSTEERFGPSGSIAVTLTQMSNIHCATMGGMLVAKDSEGHEVLFGLTVGHILHHENTIETRTLDIDLDASLRSPSESNFATGPSDNILGRLAKVSFSAQARDLDWALIQFMEGTSIAEFLLGQPSYAQDEKYIVGHCSGAVTFRPDLRLPGGAKISNLPARVVTPWGTSFIKVYPISAVLDSKCGLLSYDSANRCVEFELQEGSSGPWVVSEEVFKESMATRVVWIHGMLVADDGYGDAYMIPLAEILHDIKKGLGVSSISLPLDTNEIRRLVQLESFSLHDNAPPSLSTNTAASGATSSLNMTLTQSATVHAQSPASVHAQNASTSLDTTKWSQGSAWYCSNCGDGPMGSWEPVCFSCGHVYCSACTVEISN
jgi:hypothetical protein